MKKLLILAAIMPCLAATALGQRPPKPLVSGLNHPSAVAVGPTGKIYVALLGNEQKKGDGAGP